MSGKVDQVRHTLPPDSRSSACTYADVHNTAPSSEILTCKVLPLSRFCHGKNSGPDQFSELTDARNNPLPLQFSENLLCASRRAACHCQHATCGHACTRSQAQAWPPLSCVSGQTTRNHQTMKPLRVPNTNARAIRITISAATKAAPAAMRFTFVMLRYLGGSSCSLCTRPAQARPRRSNARLFRAMHDCAVQFSAVSARRYGRSKPLNSLRRRSDAASGLRLTRFRASASHQRGPSLSSS